jgi:hypothetical protein
MPQWRSDKHNNETLVIARPLDNGYRVPDGVGFAHTTLEVDDGDGRGGTMRGGVHASDSSIVGLQCRIVPRVPIWEKPGEGAANNW